VNLVLVVINRFTKRILYLLIIKNIDTPILIDLIYREIILYSSVLDLFITDIVVSLLVDTRVY